MAGHPTCSTIANKVKPMGPDDDRLKGENRLPWFVLEAFNDLLIRKWDGQRALIYQSEAIDEIMKHTVPEPDGYTRQDIFTNNWLNVEQAYREAGWWVGFDKKDPGSTTESSWSFRRQS